MDTKNIKKYSILMMVLWVQRNCMNVVSILDKYLRILLT